MVLSGQALTTRARKTAKPRSHEDAKNNPAPKFPASRLAFLGDSFRLPLWRNLAVTIVAGVACWAGLGCSDEDRPVVYCSVDEVFARRVLSEFEKQTGITVDAIFDTEAGKTTGLINRIRAEAAHPRADVLFSSEVLHTVLLAREGLLEPYQSPASTDIPDQFEDASHRWTGIGLRARVLVYDSQRVSADSLPTHWADLANPDVAKRSAFANPLFGTTFGHVSASFALWGEEAGREFLIGLRENHARMVDGNSVVVRAVMAGDIDFGMTDSDDVHVARKKHPTLSQRFLDMGDGGTLLIPSTVALVKGSSHPQQARELIDFLVSAQVERMLAVSASGNIPVRQSLREELEMELPPSTKLSYDQIADSMESSARAVREILIR